MLEPEYLTSQVDAPYQSTSTVKARFSGKIGHPTFVCKIEIFRYFERTYVLKIKTVCTHIF